MAPDAAPTPPETRSALVPAPLRRRELDAAAWELSGSLGLPFVVRDNGDLAVDPDALDDWWARRRDDVLAAYDARDRDA